MKALIGTKIGMTQIIDESGVVTPITLVQAGPVTVTQIKNTERDGYQAVQIAYGIGKNTSKSVEGHLAKNLKVMPKAIKEVRGVNYDEEQLKLGSSFDVTVFELGDKVKVTGTSKGKGFAGTVKRHNFHTSKRTHGGNGNVRKPGSIGSMYPQKVFKGKRMAGQMGYDQVTVTNLKIAFIDHEKHLIGIKGALPGPRKSQVFIKGIA